MPPASRRAVDMRTVALGLVVLLVAAALVVFLVLPKTGSLIITVSGPGNLAVDEVKVIVDEKARCTTSPCKVEDLSPGVHIVKVESPGYPEMAGRAVNIEAGRDQVLDLALGGAGAGTGLRIPAIAEFLRLQVDGEDRGGLPAEVTNLAPGAHKIRIAGNDRFAPYEETVEIEGGKVLELEPKLKVLRGRAKLVAGAGAEGARVQLNCPGDDRLLVQLPTSVDVSGERVCTLTATRRGYPDFETRLTFEDGKPERTFTVELTHGGGASQDSREGAEPEAASGGARVAAAGRVQAGGKEPAGSKPAGDDTSAATGMGTIRCMSTPQSTAVVSGRPLGPTPASAKLPAGTYSVLFIHPEKGRKSVSVKVKPGQTATASVKF